MSPLITIHTFPFPESVHAFFSPVAHQPGAILLESASANHPDSRYHLISADPLANLVTEQGVTTITIASQQHQSRQSPFQLIQDWIEQLLPVIPANLAGDLPFVGGALGLLGYDLGRQLEQIPELAAADLEFPDMQVGIYNWAWILDRYTSKASLLVIGDQSDWEKRWQWWQQWTPLPADPFHLTSAWHSNLTENEYLQCFDQIQAYISAGDCYQINLTQRFSACYEGDVWLAYQQLIQANQAPFSGFMRLDSQRALLSVSPERFLRVNQQDVETKPIKGTRPRSADPVTDHRNAVELANSEKDRAENLMIVDLLRNDIGRVCLPGTVRVPHLFSIESFEAVHHLVSTVTGTLPANHSAMTLMAHCFPGGSITGAPKIRAMEIIEELEPQRRSAYCGSLFYWSRHGRMDSSITIRTLIACNHRLYVSAGGGIVADSNGKEEYQETFDKLSKILTVLS